MTRFASFFLLKAPARNPTAAAAGGHIDRGSQQLSVAGRDHNAACETGHNVEGFLLIHCAKTEWPLLPKAVISHVNKAASKACRTGFNSANEARLILLRQRR